ncbi:MAG: hypothetical protein QOH88_727 [Verrucomicrobiota bacterium]|jgi:hypothetical protein
MSELRSLWRQLRVLRYPLTIALCSTAITFAFGFCAYLVIENHLPPEGFWGIWNRWDAIHYLNVAESGYGGEASGEQRFMIVFLPLFPYSIYFAHLLIPDWHAAGLVVSNLCAAGAFCFCFLLTEKELGRRAARGAVFYLSIFPTAYFFHVAYSESLFLFLTLGAFYYGRQGRWLPCALLGMLSTGSRLSGLAVMLPLAFEYFQQKKFKWREVRWDCALLGLIPLGFVAYLYLNYHYFGDPLKFLQFQREHWYRALSSPLEALQWDLAKVWTNEPIERVMQHGSLLVAFALGTGGLVGAAFRLRPCYTIYMAISWVLIYCDTFTLCSPRYLLTLFPLFMLLGQWGRRDWVHYGVTVSSLMFYGLFATQFARGWWAH